MGKDYRYFVLLADMRTGSNLFERNIQQYEGLASYGELFNPHFVGYPKYQECFGIDKKSREHDPISLLDAMVAQGDGRLCGFRLFSDHDPRMLDFCLNDRACAKIILTRNPLDSFVSYLIARQTDQWQMTDLHKQKATKVLFDFKAFKEFLAEKDTYAQNIRQSLHQTGQTAFHVDYSELNDVNVFNGIAEYLGVQSGLKSLDEKIKRQNPSDLSEKVQNYGEMCAQVKSLDLYQLGERAKAELDRNPNVPNFTCGDRVPLLFQPMSRDSHPEVINWMSQHEGGALITKLNQNKLHNWIKGHPDYKSFTVLTHPVERAYRAFYKYLFSTGPNTFDWIRANLQEHYNVALPDAELCIEPERETLQNAGYGIKEHQQAFLNFLIFLKGNLEGQTRARIDGSWAPQTAAIQGLSKVLTPQMIIRPDSLDTTLNFIEGQLGLPSLPLPVVDQRMAFSLAEIYSPEIENATRKAYNRDYITFGFSTWSSA